MRNAPPVEFSIDKCDTFKDVERLYRLVYPGKSTRKFEWLYANNPAGPADVYIVRDPDGRRVIASYVVMPMKIWLRGRTVKIGQAIDGMVHPEYRRRRIFNSIQERLHDRLKAEYEFLIGFPNRMALTPLLKAGARDFGSLATYSFPLTSQFFAKRPREGDLLHAVLSFLFRPAIALYRFVYLRTVATAGCRLEAAKQPELNEEFSFDYIKTVHPVMTVRDHEFIRWRFFSVPTDQYIFLRFWDGEHSRGYIVIRFEHKAVAIVDFCIDSSVDDQLRALRLLIDYCRHRGVKSMHFQLSEACYCTEALRKAGFIRRKNNYSIILIPYTEESETLSYSDFFLTFADTDWM